MPHMSMDFWTAMAVPVTRPADGQAQLEAQVAPQWLQGRSAFGGLQGALGAAAMRAAAGDALPLRALQMTFVAPVVEGPLRVVAERVRQGRSVTHVQCRLEQGGGVAALLVGLYGAARESRATLPLSPPPEAPPRESLRESAFDPAVMPQFLQHYRTRWIEGQRPYSASASRPIGLWASLRGRERGIDIDTHANLDAKLDLDRDPDRGRLNEAALVALADLPPTPVLAMLAQRAPAASLTWLLELLVDPRTVDATAWARLRIEPRAAGEGYVTQTGLLWDETGRGLAVTHQTVAVFG
jgi:acyl-CoA thioesterase